MERLKELKGRFDSFVERCWKEIRVPFVKGDAKSEKAAEKNAAKLAAEALVNDFAPIAHAIVVAAGKDHFADPNEPIPTDLRVADHELHKITGSDCPNTAEASRRILAWGAASFAPSELDQCDDFRQGFRIWGENNFHCAWQDGDVMRVGKVEKPFRRPRHQPWKWVAKYIEGLSGQHGGKPPSSPASIEVDLAANKVTVEGETFGVEPHHARIVDALVKARDGQGPSWYVTGTKLKTLPGCKGKKISREMKAIKAKVPPLNVLITSRRVLGYRLKR